ncbi:hypothetical protein [Streptomyces sp. NPDC059651]|uniref:hypothetical protein n=1 Tax=Streptomyces sp. NPDC059651 TaxID=3346897 RepID=UPI0036C1A49D
MSIHDILQNADEHVRSAACLGKLQQVCSAADPVIRLWAIASTARVETLPC